MIHVKFVKNDNKLNEMGFWNKDDNKLNEMGFWNKDDNKLNEMGFLEQRKKRKLVAFLY